MVTGYRMTEDEFVLLACFYELAAIPAWIVREPKELDLERVLGTLERRGLVQKMDGQDVPHPVIDFLFSEMVQSPCTAGGTDRIFCWFGAHAALALERNVTALSLLPFQTPQELFAYLRETGYERENLAFAQLDPAQDDAAARLKETWEAGFEQG